MTIIVNPAAGNGKCGRTWMAVQDRFCSEWRDATILITRAQGEATSLAQNTLLRGEKTILAVGGDGTLNEVINGFFLNQRPIGKDARLAVLPAGTGSDFCRTWKRTWDIETLRSGIARQASQSCDVGLVTCLTLDNEPVSRYFLNVSDAGFGAGVVANKKTKAGLFGARFAYLVDVLKTLLHYEPETLHLTIDQQKTESIKLLAAVVANGRYFGGGIHIAPEAKLDDGHFQIVRIGDISVLDVLSNIFMLYNGKIANHPKVTIRCGHRITMTSTADTLIETDGELIGRLPATFESVTAGLEYHPLKHKKGDLLCHVKKLGNC